jgi:hypothetical protein
VLLKPWVDVLKMIYVKSLQPIPDRDIALAGSFSVEAIASARKNMKHYVLKSQCFAVLSGFNAKHGREKK